MFNKITILRAFMAVICFISLSIAADDAVKFTLKSEKEVEKILKKYDWKKSPSDLLKDWKKGVPVVWVGKVLEVKARNLGKEVEMAWLCQYVRYANPGKTSAFSSELMIDESITGRKPFSLFSASLIMNMPIQVANQIVARKDKYFLEVAGITDSTDSYQNIGIVMLQTYKLREIPEKNIKKIPERQEEEGKFPTGIVYGPKAAFKIDAPDGWILDNQSGMPQGLPCVLYLKDYTWANSPVIMYAKIASPEYPKLKGFLSFTINFFKKESPTFQHKTIEKRKLNGEFKTIVNEYWGGPQGRYERVGYIQVKEAVCYVVLSADNKEEYNKHSSALGKAIETFEYMPDFINFGHKKD